MFQGADGIRNLRPTCLLSQGVGDEDAVTLVGDLHAYKISNVCRTRRAWLILQPLVVRLDLFVIDLDLDLRWERNIET